VEKSESATRPRRLAGRVAIVTGAGRGIGRAEAEALADEGARVVVNDVAQVEGSWEAERVAAELRDAGGEAIASTVDISRFQNCDELVALAIGRWGRLDILINNAGRRAPNDLGAFTEEQFDAVVSSHLKGSFGMTKAAAPVFAAQKSGVIVNTGSEAGLGHPYNAAYAVAKEGIAGLTRTTARELGRLGVRCNQIRPRGAVTENAMEFRRAMDLWQSHIDALGPLSLGRRGTIWRPSTVEGVACFVAWLCTDAASAINGRDFLVQGTEIGLFSEPEVVRSVFIAGAWSFEALDSYGLETVGYGLTNEFAPAT
jgi:NAD(P)-dependent dehydrogenase (short-subunit alcohol dehydrogenase family)